MTSLSSAKNLQAQSLGCKQDNFFVQQTQRKYTEHVLNADLRAEGREFDAHSI